MSVCQALPSRSSADSASRRSLRIFVYTSLSGRNRRPLGDADSAISLALQSRSIQSNQLPVPPHSGLPLFCHGGEPVLPVHCTYLGGWLARKRITCKESEHIGIVFEQSHLGIGHKWIFTPRAE